MNKKLLICGVLATGLLLTACVKKEPPKEEEQQPAQTTQQQPAPQKPTEFENLDSVPASTADAQIPTRVEVNRTETSNTTTEVRREYREATPRPQPTETRHEPRPERTSVAATPKPTATAEPAAKAETARPAATEVDTVKAETTQQAPKRSNTEAQTQDDAVAAAIAAATPALEN
jgi:PBP1b-binding outer membrane lipoprotein LpoB